MSQKHFNLYGYARISKKFVAPGDESESPERQAILIEEKARETPYQYVRTIMEKKGVSAAEVPHTKREGFKTLLTIIEPGDAVMVTDMNRLERSIFRQFAAVELLVTKRQVAVYALHPFGLKPFDMNDFGSVAMFTLRALFDQLYVQQVSERSKETHAILLAQGRKRSPVPRVGYRFVVGPHPTKPDKTVTYEEPDPLQAAVCLEVWLRRSLGESWAQIGNYLDRQGIRRWNGQKWAVPRVDRGKRVTCWRSVKKAYKAVQEAVDRGEKTFAGLPIPKVTSRWLADYPLGLYSLLGQDESAA